MAFGGWPTTSGTGETHSCFLHLHDLLRFDAVATLSVALRCSSYQMSWLDVAISSFCCLRKVTWISTAVLQARGSPNIFQFIFVEFLAGISYTKCFCCWFENWQRKNMQFFLAFDPVSYFCCGNFDDDLAEKIPRYDRSLKAKNAG